MDYKQEITDAIIALGKVGELLSRLSRFTGEMKGPSENFERFFSYNGYGVGERERALRNLLDGRSCAENVDLQVNRIEKSLTFTKKEISDMPRLKDCKIRFKNNVYEIRYRKHGYDVSFSSKNLNTAKSKACEWLKKFNGEIYKKENFVVVKSNQDLVYNKQTKFGPFAQNFMLKVKKIRVKEKTFTTYYKNFQKYVMPRFSNMYLKDIKPIILQEYLDIINKKTPRACEDVKTLLNNIFEYAIANGVIELNPMKAVYIEKHERLNGKALTLEEEKQFLVQIKESELELVLVLALYTGLRRCELNSAKFDFEKNTISVKNGKLKSYQKNLYRTFPIFPKLKPYLERFKNESWRQFTKERHLMKFKTFLPNHTLKDLRHTFTSRAKECLIPDEVVSLWTGHSLGSITARVYTHYSNEFMQEQAKKLDY